MLRESGIQHTLTPRASEPYARLNPSSAGHLGRSLYQIVEVTHLENGMDPIDLLLSESLGDYLVSAPYIFAFLEYRLSLSIHPHSTP